MKEKKLRASVTVIGIKKRCRKTERHSLQLGHHNPDVSEGFLVEQGKLLLIREMRTVERASLSIFPVEISYERGFTSESFKICDPSARTIPLTMAVAHA